MVTLEELLCLQNGTDVRGVALAGVEDEPITLDEEKVASIAKAFCVWLKEKLNKSHVCVAVGYDSRLSSPMLSNVITNALVSIGDDVLLTGLSTTPSMFMLLKDVVRRREYPCDGAIMITASHLPFNRNGMKFFHADGGVEKKDITKILRLAVKEMKPTEKTGKAFFAPYLDDYAASLVDLVRTATGEVFPLQGKRIVVDAGNGVGGFFVEKVLMPLGANTEGSQFLTPDGHFPNHIPNPEDVDAMEAVCAAVKRVNADFGIIFDTDVDRAAAVDYGGVPINRNRLIALVSAILLEERAGTIVTDSVTSNGLTQFIIKKGGKHQKFRRGYKNVINEAIRLNATGEYAPLAIETSGHAAFQENYFLDDGAYLITKLLIALARESKKGRRLTQLIADMPLPKEEKEIRVGFQKGVDFQTLGARVIEAFTIYAKTQTWLSVATDNYEGVRVNYKAGNGAGWALLRMSLHDPILAINAESDEEGGTNRILADIYSFLQQYDFINLSAFDKLFT
jgi:phosphomannomutase